jgi:endonuclease/exonuclease/phosphatase family metal-dependent hydrolase
MDLKIMTFNVLNGWNTTHIGERDDLAASVILSQLPDVLCLQELDPCYRMAEQPLPELIAAHYTEVGEEHTTWNPIFYNHSKLRVAAHGELPFTCGTVYNYPGGGLSGFRTVFYALLETRDGSDRFLVLNLHYDMCKDPARCRENQADESREAVALAESLMQKHGVSALFVTGDYNARIDGVPCVYMLKNGIVDTRAPAAERDDTGSCSRLGEPLWGDYSHAIDHVLYRGNRALTVHRYQTIDSIRAASDHAPILVSLSLH